MPEQIFPIEVVGVDYICDNCGQGNMEPYGNVILTCDPPRIPHKCSNCGYDQSFTERYPAVRHQRVDANKTAHYTDFSTEAHLE